MAHEDTRSAVQGLWDEHTPSRSRPGCEGEVGGVEMVALRVGNGLDPLADPLR
jgi:hypothetical protein